MGLARMTGLADDANRDRLTGSGQMMGTCDYMAPEQSFDAHQADARADIYSLGCTLFRLVTGHVLYKGQSLMQICLAHRESPVPSLCQDRPDAPSQLDAVYRKMVAKRPEDRYQSMTGVIAALEACVGKSGSTATTVGEAPTVAPTVFDDLSFLEPASPGGTATAAKKKAQTFAETTLSQQAAAAETSKLPGRGLPGRARKKKTPAVRIGLGLLGIAGIVVLLTIIYIQTSKGTLEIETDDQDVEVAVKQNGNLVEVVDAKSGWKISLRSGEYELAMQGSTDKVQLDQNSVVVTRGKTVKVKVTLKPPSEFSNLTSEISDFKSPLPAIGSLIGPDGKWKLPPGAPPLAIAPFDAKKAKEHQEAWAKYLGVPVEITSAIGMKLVLIPPGEFQMGSPKELIEEELKTTPKDDKWYLDRPPGEGPRHHVRITRPFYLGMYPVTQEEYQRVMGASPSEFSATGKSKDKVAGQDTKRFPVEMVSWQDTDEFCSRLSEMAEEKSTGRRYRLPSEAQWEYACRAGSTGRYFFSAGSDDKKAAEGLLPEYAWFSNNAGGRPHTVGGRRASPWGLYDMYGNVWQWCQDSHANDYYAKSPADDPVCSSGGSNRMHRGGGWDFPAWSCRSAGRYHVEAGYRYFVLGFRVTLVLPEKSAEQAIVPAEPIVPAKPVPLELKPDGKAWDLKTQ